VISAGPRQAETDRVIDLAKSEVVRTVRTVRQPPRWVALSTVGLYLADTGDGEAPPITIWDVETGREVKRFTGLRGGRYVVMSTMTQFAAKQVQVDVADGGAVENVNLSLDPQGP
jgi:hypothetical protein